jgi:hypothetical protein
MQRLSSWTRRTRFINLRFKISRLLNQDGSKLRVCGFLGELEKRRHLTDKIIPTQHDVSPRYALLPSAKTRRRDFGSGEMYKSALRELGAGGELVCSRTIKIEIRSQLNVI